MQAWGEVFLERRAKFRRKGASREYPPGQLRASHPRSGCARCYSPCRSSPRCSAIASRYRKTASYRRENQVEAKDWDIAAMAISESRRLSRAETATGRRAPSLPSAPVKALLRPRSGGDRHRSVHVSRVRGVY